jgi:hypothetical protein
VKGGAWVMLRSTTFPRYHSQANNEDGYKTLLEALNISIIMDSLIPQSTKAINDAEFNLS